MTSRLSVRAQARENYREMVAEKAAGRVVPSAPQPEAPPTPDPSPPFAAQTGGGEKGNLTARVRALYEGSAVPVREIARLAGVTERTIYKYAAKHDWKPRYRWPHPQSPQGRPRPAGETHALQGDAHRRAGFAPVKGAGGRFIRREDEGKPIAQGLKATDPAAHARASADCAEAARQARAAQIAAEREQLSEKRLSAIAVVNRALGELTAYRAERRLRRAKQRPPRPAPHDDALERAFRLQLDVAVDCWEMLLAQERRLLSAARQEQAPSGPARRDRADGDGEL